MVNGSSDSVDDDDGEGHEDGDDDEGGLQVFFDYLSALDGGEAFLFEETAAIFFMMTMMFGHNVIICNG